MTAGSTHTGVPAPGSRQVRSRAEHGHDEARAHTHAPTSSTGSGSGSVAAIRALQHSAGNRATHALVGGEQLPPVLREQMESRFGADFGTVRVHHGDVAAESAGAESAKAYTVGRDIVFGADEWSPDTTSGQWLLAHELAHVVQHSRGGPPALANRASPLEAGAHAAADTVSTGTGPVAVSGAASPGLSKADDDDPTKKASAPKGGSEFPSPKSGAPAKAPGAKKVRAPATFGDVKQYSRQGKALWKDGGRVSEHEHVGARVNLRLITTDPTTGKSPYNKKAYRRSTTVTIPEDMARAKTRLDLALRDRNKAGSATAAENHVQADIDRTIQAREEVRATRIKTNQSTGDLDAVTNEAIIRSAHGQQGELHHVGKKQRSPIAGASDDEIDKVVSGIGSALEPEAVGLGPKPPGPGAAKSAPPPAIPDEPAPAVKPTASQAISPGIGEVEEPKPIPSTTLTPPPVTSPVTASEANSNSSQPVPKLPVAGAIDSAGLARQDELAPTPKPLTKQTASPGSGGEVPESGPPKAVAAPLIPHSEALASIIAAKPPMSQAAQTPSIETEGVPAPKTTATTSTAAPGSALPVESEAAPPKASPRQITTGGPSSLTGTLGRANTIGGALLDAKVRRQQLVDSGVDSTSASLEAGGRALLGLAANLKGGTPAHLVNAFNSLERALQSGQGLDEAVVTAVGQVGGAELAQRVAKPSLAGLAVEGVNTAAQLIGAPEAVTLTTSGAAELVPQQILGRTFTGGARSLWALGKGLFTGDAKAVDDVATDFKKGGGGPWIQGYAQWADIAGNMASGDSFTKALDKAATEGKGSWADKAGGGLGEAFADLGENEKALRGDYTPVVQGWAQLSRIGSEMVRGKSFIEASEVAGGLGKGGLLEKVGSTIGDKAYDAVEKTTEIVNEDLPKIKAAITQKAAQLRDEVVSLKNESVEAASSVREGAVELKDAALDTVSAYGGRAVDTASHYASAAGDAISDTYSSAKDRLKQAWSSW